MPDPNTLRDWQAQLSRAAEAERLVAHRAFLAWLANAPSSVEATPEQVAFFREAHARYLIENERVATARLVQALADGPDPGTTKQSLASRLDAHFGASAYNRLSGLAAMIGRTPRHVVMVGCGPLPVTLFYVRDHWPEATAVGLDIDAESTSQALGLAAALGVEGVRLATIDGATYDYAGADFIYVANIVCPKARVLERIAQTAAPDATVVVRDPAGAGGLLAEPIADAPSPPWRVAGAGPASRAYLSRDVLLRRSDAP